MPKPKIIDLDSVVFKQGDRYYRLKQVEEKQFDWLRTFFPALHVKFCVPTIQEVGKDGKKKGENSSLLSGERSLL